MLVLVVQCDLTKAAISAPLFQGGTSNDVAFEGAKWGNTSKRFPHQNKAVGLALASGTAVM